MRRFLRALGKPYNLLRLAAAGALLALALMVAAFLLPGPVPLILFMSLGQGLGTLSFVAYLVVIALELRRAGVLSPKDSGDDGVGADDRERASAERGGDPEGAGRGDAP